jgi:hypothetical protein
MLTRANRIERARQVIDKQWVNHEGLERAAHRSAEPTIGAQKTVENCIQHKG